MRILLSLGCVAACVAIGGRLAWKALDLDAWADESDACSIASLIHHADAPTPENESLSVMKEDSLVPTINLPKVEVLDKLNKPTRGAFGSRGLSPVEPGRAHGSVVVPSTARAGLNRSASAIGSTASKTKISAYESAPGQTFGFNVTNPLTTALNTRYYTKPRFNFTSDSRRLNNGNINRKPSGSMIR